MRNHRGGRNRRQPYDEWSYSNPSSPPPFCFSLISADIPCTYTANHCIEHSEIILEKQFTPSCACTFGVRIVICKPQRKTSEPPSRDLLFKISKHQHDDALACWNIASPLVPVLLQQSLGLWMRKGGGKKILQVKSIIEIPHPSPPPVWPIGILQDPLAPYGVPNLQLGRKE